ncbi:MAG: DUF697 domain-containing protein [Longimicrobiales bacterium]
MRRTIVRVAVLLALLAVAAFVVFMVGETAQVVALATQVHPTLGQAVLWALLFTYAFCVIVPFWLLIRLPKPLVPPESEEGPAFEKHIDRLTKRLQGHPVLKGNSLASRVELESAIRSLDARADELTKAAAAQVFLTTAVSQNGSLDAVVVLAAQSQLVLRIARVYYQRPTLRDLIYLYGNVASTAFISSELEDVDLAAQIQPVLSSLLGSAAGAIPGLQAATALVVNSITTGSANAFLTLRVGTLARQYCGALVAPARRNARRSATLVATQLLGSIVADGAARVTAAVWSASRRRVGGAIGGVGGYLKEASEAVAEKFRFGRPASAPPGGDPTP